MGPKLIGQLAAQMFHALTVLRPYCCHSAAALLKFVGIQTQSICDPV